MLRYGGALVTAAVLLASTACVTRQAVRETFIDDLESEGDLPVLRVFTRERVLVVYEGSASSESIVVLGRRIAGAVVDHDKAVRSAPTA